LTAPGFTDTRVRLLSVAAGLFAKYGYDGISTRDIAAATGISEITVYRHYPRKRDLYCAALESELGKIQLRGDLLAHLAASPNPGTALDRTYEMIEKTLEQSPALLRLIEFGALELRSEVEPLLHRYLAQFIEVLAGYLRPWTEKGELGNTQPRSVVLMLVAIVFSRQVLESIFQEGTPKADAMVDACAEMLHHV
jgi:AcrR family transcriptional regulator